MGREHSRRQCTVLHAGRDSNIPKFRSVADERLSRAMKRAFDSQEVPSRLTTSVMAIFRDGNAGS
ncbi:MAG: hypothetical protein IPM63_11535 [Acidobacteriota bacterium]|nr:MAG: hypothetical protein IPM63_11535 [Acidobacteriota bacterium]